MVWISLLAAAQAQVAPEVASLYSKEGKVEGLIAPEMNWKDIEKGTSFKAQDSIRVDRYGRAGIVLSNGVFFRLTNQASIRFQNPDVNTPDQRPIEMDQGKAHFFSRKPSEIPVINTPIVSAALRGTEITIEVNKDTTLVSVLDGNVECRNQFGSVVVGAGEQALTHRGSAPVKSILVNPVDAVQWALYYPNIVDLSDYADFLFGASAGQQEGWELLKKNQPEQAILKFSGSDWHAVFGRSVANFLRGNMTAALERAYSKQANQLPSFSLHIARLFLNQGQVEESHKFLEQSLKSISLAPHDSQARIRSAVLAQKALIQVVQNKKQQAAELIAQALESDPRTISAHLAAAYVKQAFFDLPQAQLHILRALELNPQQDFAWARLAELQLGSGDVESARQSIMAALSINQDSSYTQAIFGFTALIQRDLDSSQRAFERSIELDNGLGLPHLGLGLVLISKGQLGAGRMELQSAVHLEPLVALYRSYLGKVFFEDGKEDLAQQEYETAIKLDPNDPTPYLYRAFNQLSKNNPIGALSDVEESIQRNDNRAVYRSRLLLDQDLGTRSAGLAQVFSVLGFSEAARTEAVKSINRDYSNYSAHRLLSESQDSVVLADASLSERRIADLLSPLSFNLFNSVGGEASLNEYSALFDKSEHRTGSNLIYDNRSDRFSEELFHAGKSGNFGYFTGLDTAFGGGSKTNNFLRDYRWRLAGQAQLSYQDRIILEGLTKFRDIHDNHDNFQDSDLESYEIAAGYNHSFGAGSSLIGQITFDKNLSRFQGLTTDDIDITEASSGNNDTFTDNLFVNAQTHEGLERVRSSLQYIYDTSVISSVLGGQVFITTADRNEQSTILSDDSEILTDIEKPLVSSGDNTLNATDFYWYNTLHLTRWLDLNLGLSRSVVEIEQREVTPFVDGTISQNKWSPKFGITAYPLSNLTTYAGYFETLRKSSLEDQAALEPTIIGGLNQRYNDLAGTTSQNFGFGFDYKTADFTYFGASFVHRDLSEQSAEAYHQLLIDYDTLNSQPFTSDVQFGERHLNQDFSKAYLYQVLSSNFAATLDFQLIEQERTDPDLMQSVRLSKSALGLRYFSESRFFAFSKATWRRQTRSQSFYLDDGTSSFWVIDAGLGYRLPERHGNITFELLNLAGKRFDYDQSLGFEPGVKPDFGFRFVASLNF